MAIPAPSSQREMRRRNLSRVLYAVAEADQVSRAAVAARIGLTRASVSTLVEELLRAGFLVELGPGRSGGVGRPGNALALTDLGPCGLGAEIGVDHLTVCAVDLRGQVRARRTDEAPNRGEGPASVLRRLGSLTERVSADAGAAGLRPAGLAVAVPGLVTRSSTTVVHAPNLGWHDTDIAEHLPGPLRLTVDNEANFGALAELWQREPEDAPADFVHVSAEVGIGAAVVLDGELLRGRRGFAGELGHVPVEPDGPDCACGGSGCLEQYAGEAAMLGAAGVEASGAGGRSAALAELQARAERGDPDALAALRRAGGALGIALAAAVNLLDPRAVVLGGTLAGLAPWLLPSLEAELRRRTAAPGAVPELAVSAIGSAGPSLGAAHSVVRTVLSDPLPYAAAR
ncbi:Sugar kinase of the NBD/HSP70 family, may contain an N-terminal HTH domain [Streptomyces sp. WMMB 714]|uniref:ROK family transcriptional regulator n=1 Tax=Streptomyces sp. WMMB 714 TaxID=1286822 RepID=UPI0005F87EB3|nr:ROK family transcriptional regulator [Streptomyces sp. WMMB 714]SCK09013.1 Sugar kinase of the NBD/HSP70 family, may contain an N-terminal HTH domain [Streptomyces sp. WMMB 714]